MQQKYTQTHITLSNMALKKKPLDLEYVFSLIQTSPKFDLMALCFEVLYSHRLETFDQLKTTYYSTSSEGLKYAIVFVSSLEPDLVCMTFLIDVYIKSEQYRSLIRKKAFTDKGLTLIALNHWVLNNTLTKKSELVVSAILSLIPRETILGLANFSHSPLARLYFLL